MRFASRPASVRSLRIFQIGLILLLLLGAPLNLALPHAMARPVMPGIVPSGAIMAGGHSPDCPGAKGSDHGSPQDHASLCLFCVAFGGPSLAGSSLEPATKPPALAVTAISFGNSRNEIMGGHRDRTQSCRDPPAAA